MPEREYGLREDDKQGKSKWPMYGYLLFVLLSALAAMCCATQNFATAYGFHPGLGPFWFVAFGKAVYAPWMIFSWSGIPGSEKALDNATTVGQMAFLLPQFLVIALWLSRGKLTGNTRLHGSAHWAREGEIQKMGYFGGNGVYVGGWWNAKKKYQRYLRHNGPEHVLCFAPTRSGKGVGLILPTLLSWSGSSLVLDIKGENWALTSGWRKSQGHTVLRFDPTDVSGAGCKFNPLEEVRLDTLFAVQDAQNMALMIVDPDGKGLEDHWTKAAFAFFSGIVLHCCIMIRAGQGRAATLQDLTLMLADENRTTKELLEEMLSEDHADLMRQFAPDADERAGAAAHTFIASSAREMLSKADNEASGVLSSALVNMSLYRDPIVGINTERSDFRIADLMHRDQPVDLYLVVPPDNSDRVKPLLRLMLDLIVRRICKDMQFRDGASVAGYKHRLLFMLDEFTALGKLPIIEKAIAFIAGYGGKLYIIVQDIDQLNAVYGEKHGLIGNCHVRIAYAPNTVSTAKILSEMTGNTTVIEEKVSITTARGGQQRTKNITETARALLTPDECMRLLGPLKDEQGRVLKPGHMLIFTAGQSPIYGLQILYFKDPVFSVRAKMPAPGVTSAYPTGITDSLYFPRPAEWYTDQPVKEAVPPALEEKRSEKSFEAFFAE